MWVCYLLFLWLGSMNREESLYCREQILILFYLGNCDATLSLYNRANRSKARLTDAFLAGKSQMPYFRFRMWFSLVPLKRSLLSFNIASIPCFIFKPAFKNCCVACCYLGANAQLVRSSCVTACCWGRGTFFEFDISLEILLARLNSIVLCHTLKPQ